MVLEDSTEARAQAKKPGLGHYLPCAVVVLFIALATLLPRAVGLDRFATPDEHLWLYRSANFYYALGQRDFASTYQKEHPGVTTMWAGMAGFLTRFPGYRGSGLGQIDSPQLDYYLRKIAQVPPLEILVASRYFIVLGNTLVLLLGFLYARSLIGTPAAVVGLLLIAFDPFHIALTRLLHLDGSLSSLLLLSLLAFISYLHRRNIIDLIISGLVAGLSWLTKSPAFFIIPTVGLITLLDFGKSFSVPNKITLTRRIWDYLWPLIVWGSVAVLIFFLLWPAMWVAPLQTLESIIGQAQQYAVKGHHSPIFFNGRITESGDLGIEYFYFYPLTYLWRSTPVVLIGLLAAILGYFKKREPLNRPETRLAVLGIVIFVLIFTMVMTFGTKKFDRYLLPVFPPLDILAAIGWVSLAHWLVEKAPHSSLRYSPHLILVSLIGLQMFLSLRTFPYYLSYYNPLMGGGSKAPEVMQIGWGEGIDQAARYLNNKPNAEHLRVGAWYSMGSFSYFFSGHTHALSSNPELNEGQWQRFLNADYAVIYIHQWQRYVPKQVLDYLSGKTPEHTISINGIDYVEIYKIR
jgi:hypothetical protein